MRAMTPSGSPATPARTAPVDAFSPTLSGGKGEGDLSCVLARPVLPLSAGMIDESPPASTADQALLSVERARRQLEVWQQSDLRERVDVASREAIDREMTEIGLLLEPVAVGAARNEAMYVWAHERAMLRLAVLAARAEPEVTARELVDALGLRESMLHPGELLRARRSFLRDEPSVANQLSAELEEGPLPPRSVLAVAAAGDRDGVPLDEALAVRQRLLDQQRALAAARPEDARLQELARSQLERARDELEVLDSVLRVEIASRAQNGLELQAPVLIDLSATRSTTLLTGLMVSSLQSATRSQRLLAVNRELQRTSEHIAGELGLRTVPVQAVATEVWATYAALFPPDVDPHRMPAVYYPHEELVVLSPGQSSDVVRAADGHAGTYQAGHMHELGHVLSRNARAALRDPFEHAMAEAFAEDICEFGREIETRRNLIIGRPVQWAHGDAYPRERAAYNAVRQALSADGWNRERMLRELGCARSMMQTMADALAGDEPEPALRRQWLQNAMMDFWSGKDDAFSSRLKL